MMEIDIEVDPLGKVSRSENNSDLDTICDHTIAQDDDQGYDTMITHDNGKNHETIKSPNIDVFNNQTKDLEVDYDDKQNMTPNDEYLISMGDERNHYRIISSEDEVNAEHITTVYCGNNHTGCTAVDSKCSHRHKSAPIDEIIHQLTHITDEELTEEQAITKNDHHEQMTDPNTEQTVTSIDTIKSTDTVKLTDTVTLTVTVKSTDTVKSTETVKLTDTVKSTDTVKLIDTVQIADTPTDLVIDHNIKQDIDMKEEETEQNYNDDAEIFEPAPDVYDTYFNGDDNNSENPSNPSNIVGHDNLDKIPDLAVMYIYLLARYKDEESLLKHLSKSSDINKKDTHGRTALTYAQEDKHNGAIDTLLACGANPLLGASPGDGNVIDEDFLFRQLYCAARADNGHGIISQMNCSIDLRNEHGDNVLMVLVKEGNFNGVLNMLEAGAKVEENVLLAAETSDNMEIVQLLCTYQDKQTLELSSVFSV